MFNKLKINKKNGNDPGLELWTRDGVSVRGFPLGMMVRRRATVCRGRNPYKNRHPKLYQSDGKVIWTRRSVSLQSFPVDCWFVVGPRYAVPVMDTITEIEELINNIVGRGGLLDMDTP